MADTPRYEKGKLYDISIIKRSVTSAAPIRRRPGPFSSPLPRKSRNGPCCASKMNIVKSH